jgi:hypothetical protein
MSQDLHDYIKSAREHGSTDDQIRQALVSTGWDAAQVSAALSNHNAAPPDAAAPTTPPSSAGAATPITDPAAVACLQARRKRFWQGMQVIFLLPLAISIVYGIVAGGGHDAGESSLVADLMPLIGLVFYIIGVKLMLRPDSCDQVVFDARSGQGEASPVPEGIKQWNWGAFLLPWLWGPANRTTYFLWLLVPIYNIIVWINLGRNGNVLAWQQERWLSPEHFHQVQRRWAKAGWIYTIVTSVVPIVLLLLFSAALLALFSGGAGGYPADLPAGFNAQELGL